MMMDDITAAVYMSTLSIVGVIDVPHYNLLIYNLTLLIYNHFIQLTINIYHNISVSVASLSFVCRAINHQTVIM